MDHQTKTVRKRVMRRKSHILHHFMAGFEETGAVVKVSDRITILGEYVLNEFLEVVICYLKVGALFLWHFFVLVRFLSPKQSQSRVSPQEFQLLPKFLVEFNKINPYRKVSGSILMIYMRRFLR